MNAPQIQKRRPIKRALPRFDRDRDGAALHWAMKILQATDNEPAEMRAWPLERRARQLMSGLVGKIADQANLRAAEALQRIEVRDTKETRKLMEELRKVINGR